MPEKLYRLSSLTEPTLIKQKCGKLAKDFMVTIETENLNKVCLCSNERLAAELAPPVTISGEAEKVSPPIVIRL